MAGYAYTIAFAIFFGFFRLPSQAAAQVPEALAAPGGVKVLEVHAEGAQIYECKAGGDGNLTWQFREPVASLMQDGKTIGRHYAGPTWELADGSAVTGKVVARAAGSSKGDIPWLKLDVASHRGHGQLDEVTVIQRINTKGGATEGSCTAAGAFLAVPYSSEYVFLK